MVGSMERYFTRARAWPSCNSGTWDWTSSRSPGARSAFGRWRRMNWRLVVVMERSKRESSARSIVQRSRCGDDKAFADSEATADPRPEARGQASSLTSTPRDADPSSGGGATAGPSSLRAAPPFEAQGKQDEHASSRAQLTIFGPPRG